MDQVNRPGRPVNNPPLIQHHPAGQATWPGADQLSRIWSGIPRPIRPLIGAVIFSELKFLITGDLFKSHILDLPFAVCLVLALREHIREDLTELDLTEPSFVTMLARITVGLLLLNPEQEAPTPELHAHLQPGGLADEFEKQRPTAGQIRAIHNQIKPVWKLMAADGIDKGGIKFHLPKDFITLDSFSPSEVVEWCALKTDEGHFSLMRAATAIELIQRGSTNPISRKPLQAMDFIRGEALLGFFKAGKH